MRSVAITSGPTQEPLDEVRYFSNRSTGRLGVELAASFAGAGYRVCFFHGPGALKPQASEAVALQPFTTAASLGRLLIDLFGRPGSPRLLVHAAAVADYAPEPVPGKLSSSEPELLLRLRPTPKLADLLRHCHPELPMILFKLESGIERAELHRRARATLERVGALGIVANLAEQVTETSHRADFLRRDGTLHSLETRSEIAACLVREADALFQPPPLGEDGPGASDGPDGRRAE